MAAAARATQPAAEQPPVCTCSQKPTSSPSTSAVVCAQNGLAAPVPVRPAITRPSISFLSMPVLSSRASSISPARTKTSRSLFSITFVSAYATIALSRKAIARPLCRSATFLSACLFRAHARRGFVEELVKPRDRLGAAGVFRHHAFEEQAVVVGHVLQPRQTIGDREIRQRRVFTDLERQLFRFGHR